MRMTTSEYDLIPLGSISKVRAELGRGRHVLFRTACVTPDREAMRRGPRPAVKCGTSLLWSYYCECKVCSVQVDVRRPAGKMSAMTFTCQWAFR